MQSKQRNKHERWLHIFKLCCTSGSVKRQARCTAEPPQHSSTDLKRNKRPALIKDGRPFPRNKAHSVRFRRNAQMSTEKRENNARVCCLFAMSLNMELTPCAERSAPCLRAPRMCVENTSNVKLKEKASQANSWVRRADLGRKTPHILLGTTHRSNSKWTARGTENKQETKMKLKLFYCVVLSRRGQKRKSSPCFKVNVIFATDMVGNKSCAGNIPVKGMK